jgi:DNA polymerase-4
VRRELLAISTRVAARLRRHGLKGKTICLKVKYADFRMVTRETTLRAATDDGGEIFRHALSLLERTDAGKRSVRLLGIYLSHFGEEDAAEGGLRQMPLFGGPPDPPPPTSRKASSRDPDRSTKLNAALDRIQEKYGNGAIGPGTLAGKDGK